MGGCVVEMTGRNDEFRAAPQILHPTLVKGGAFTMAQPKRPKKKEEKKQNRRDLGKRVSVRRQPSAHLQGLEANAVQVTQDLQPDAAMPRVNRGGREDGLARAAAKIVEHPVFLHVHVRSPPHSRETASTSTRHANKDDTSQRCRNTASPWEQQIGLWSASDCQPPAPCLRTSLPGPCVCGTGRWRAVPG